jgi:hydroxyacylglutathione hydrolase
MYHDMLESLLKVSKLPTDTLLYPAHEYTVDTLKFATRIDPHNTFLKKRLTDAITKKQHRQPTLPVLLSDELKTNPFLRCADPTIKAKVESLLHRSLNTPEAVFTALRHWKNTNG